VGKQEIYFRQKGLLFNIFTPEDETNTLSQNNGNKLPRDMALYPRTTKTSNCTNM
jgi:hypothetical protein